MRNSMSRKALITGITGQDGVYLARMLLDMDYKVVGFGRRSSILMRTDLKNLYDKIEFAYGDMVDAVDIADAIQHHQPDEIYNFAAQSAPGMSWAQSIETGEITGMGAHRLLEAVRRFKPDCRVYQASSSEMFGDVLQSPQSETTPFNPINPYAAAKVYAHQMAGIYRRSYNMFICCGILFNHESPYRAMKFLTQKVSYGAACAKLKIRDSKEINEEGEPIVKNGKLTLGNLDASRDWGHAKDYVRAMWSMLQRETPDDYTIGTGVLRSVRELCEVAYKHVNEDWREHVITDPRFMRPSDTGPTIADASKARNDLKWKAVTSFEEMVSEMVDSHISNLSN